MVVAISHGSAARPNSSSADNGWREHRILEFGRLQHGNWEFGRDQHGLREFRQCEYEHRGYHQQRSGEPRLREYGQRNVGLLQYHRRWDHERAHLGLLQFGERRHRAERRHLRHWKRWHPGEHIGTGQERRQFGPLQRGHRRIGLTSVGSCRSHSAVRRLWAFLAKASVFDGIAIRC